MRSLAIIVSLASILIQTTSGGGAHLQQMVVTVTDKSGQFVHGLRASDFVIHENGEKKGVARFLADSSTPISLGVLIDTSGSMATADGGANQPRWTAAIGAIRAMLRLLKPQDEFMLMTFDSDLRIVLGFTNGQNKVESHLRELVPNGMGTNLFGSTEKALKEIKKAHNRRRGLVVITDAEDTGGSSIAALRESIYTEELPVYTFALRPQPGAGGGFGGRGFGGGFGRGGGGPTASVGAALDTLAGDDSRRALTIEVEKLKAEETPVRIVTFVQNIAIELRGQYTLGYYTEASGPVWKRVIRMKTSSPNHQVHIRRETLEAADSPK